MTSVRCLVCGGMTQGEKLYCTAHVEHASGALSVEQSIELAEQERRDLAEGKVRLEGWWAREVLAMLTDGPCTSQRLAGSLRLEGYLLMRLLEALEEAGRIESERQRAGRPKLYALPAGVSLPDHEWRADSPKPQPKPELALKAPPPPEPKRAVQPVELQCTRCGASVVWSGTGRRTRFCAECRRARKAESRQRSLAKLAPSLPKEEEPMREEEVEVDDVELEPEEPEEGEEEAEVIDDEEEVEAEEEAEELSPALLLWATTRIVSVYLRGAASQVQPSELGGVVEAVRAGLQGPRGTC